MNRKAVRTLLQEESRFSLGEQIASVLIERIAEKGGTVGATARRLGMEDKAFRRSLFERKNGMSLMMLERICTELDLEVRLLPKGRK